MNKTISIMFEADFHCGIILGTEGEEKADMQSKKFIILAPENILIPAQDDLLRIAKNLILQEAVINPESIRFVGKESGISEAHYKFDLANDQETRNKWSEGGGQLPE